MSDSNLIARTEEVIADMRGKMLADQQDEGHWVYPLEPDATCAAEYLLYRHFRGNLDGDYAELERKICVYLRRTQEAHGGWALSYRGDINISSTVKAYYALKLAGDDIDAPHMVRARQATHSVGGAETANVFTRITLFQFGQVPWQAVTCMPVEIMLLPRWIFHVGMVSYWARTVLVPLLVLMALRLKAKNPRGIGVSELFVTPPDQVKTWHVNPTGSVVGNVFFEARQIPAVGRAEAV